MGSRLLQKDFPRFSLQEALAVPEAIWSDYGSDPTPPHDVAMALDISPTGSKWRVLSGAAHGYGLTTGGYNADTIGITELGERAVAPTKEGQDQVALVEAVLRPSIMEEFFRKYDRGNFPRDKIAGNVLRKMGVPEDKVEDLLPVLKENARYTNIAKDTGDNLYVSLDALKVKPSSNTIENGIDEQVKNSNPSDVVETNGSMSEGSKQDSSGLDKPDQQDTSKPIFIAHGKNEAPLQAVKSFLDKFEVPFKVATDEAHGGRPISRKVKDTMEQCGSAIVIFTKDTKYFDEEDNEIWKPSENVAHELGASLFAYDNRVVIFKEEGLELPSNYRDIGHIEFESDSFEEKTSDLLSELIELGLVEIKTAT